MNIIVVYKSLSGFTEKYAKWIAEDLKTDCLNIKNFNSRLINEDTIIIFGGSLHAVGINGFRTLKRKIRKSNYKQLLVFAVGASPKKSGIEKEIKEANFKKNEGKATHLFYLRGGFDYSKLDFLNKILMTLLKFKIQSKKSGSRTGDEKGLLASYEKPLDVTRRENINVILDYIKSIK